MREVLVVNYGMGNIHSIVKALRLYADAVHFSADPERIAKAPALALPGDGAFAAAMQGLHGEIRAAFLQRVAEGAPTLGVCIGFQILFENSDEAIGAAANTTDGLALIPGRIRRFRPASAEVRVPHMGWNEVRFVDGAAASMYFIHSYRAEGVPPEFVAGVSEYGEEKFPAVVQRGNLLATQFHPEKSDLAGLAFLKRWVASLS
ncbi:MAG: imidazole glycerol phosphate synthase subunit HisH [Leptospirales bacterium]|nr:imidazole glycerol phosphate synthase subunit HisH [Leptospirales bacterium]